MNQALHTHAEWRQMAADLEPAAQAIIGGEFVDAASGESFRTVDPATGATIAQVAAGGPEDVDRAVRSARESFGSGVWSSLPPAERKAVLLRLSELLAADQDKLALLDSMDMGKPVEEAAAGVLGSAATVQWYAEAVDKIYGEIGPTGPGDLALVSREPLGVIGAVVPWNFPLDLAIWKVAPALAAGNSVVLKPAEQSPLSAIRLGELALEAGLPPGVLNVVPGMGETAGRALGLHRDVDCLAFTGSTEVGRFFLSYSAESNGKPVWLECGGKSPNVVFADAGNLDEVADMAALGIFRNQGEVCSANSRLVVERSIRDEILERIVARADEMVLGDPLDPATGMGPLVDEHHAGRVMSFIDDAREAAQLRCGGERFGRGDSQETFVTPTVFGEVPSDIPLAQEEIFGPVLAVLDFEGEEEAVQVANNTKFGLAASLWTSDLNRAHRLAARLKVGTVSVNTVDALSAQTPFGGFKESGFGRDLSLHAFDKYTGLKTTWIKYS